jgi:hypothetical protein
MDSIAGVRASSSHMLVAQSGQQLTGRAARRCTYTESSQTQGRSSRAWASGANGIEVCVLLLVGFSSGYWRCLLSSILMVFLSSSLLIV